MTALGVALSGCGGTNQSKPTAQATTQIGRVASRSADARLLDAITAGDYKRNMVVSPYGLRRLFGMLVEGARGATHDQIVAALGVGGAADVPEPILAGFTDRDGMWIERGSATSAAFESAVRGDFGAEVFHVDFQAPGTIDAIQRWVSAATGGQIPRIPLLRPRFVAIDALAYKVTWAHQFKGGLMRPGPFRTGTGTVRVPLMRETGDMQYLSDPQGQYVRLPFTDGNSMLVALPKRGLTPLTLSHAVTVLDQVRSVESVDLTLPRFSTRSFVDLVSPLMNLGVKAAFLSPDFSPIFGRTGFGPNDVFQEGAIDVDEHGARMSVVSVADEQLGPRRGPIPFNVDHPFAFVVEDTKTQQVLVAGIVAHP